MSNSTRCIARTLATIVAASTIVGCFSDSTGPGGPANIASDEVTLGVPAGWFGGASVAGDYKVGLDRTVRHGGGAAGFIQGLNSASSSFASLAQSIRADSYRGKRVRWSAWVKTENASGTDVGLWMRVDSPGVVTSFDNMSNRPLRGTQDWQPVSVVLDVAQNAIGIAAGALLSQSGVLFIDDAKFEVVGTDVASTNILTAPLTASADSATTAAAYARDNAVPINLDFEGVAPIPATADAWLGSSVIPLTTTDPTASLADLQPLAQMVGQAHLIGLGEDTHGTREFFQMKHRILELMVKQLGATYFAIEATSPESDDMNQYVLNGVGDPNKLRSRLYFWTWNTEEVADMIQWMREWNTTAPANQRVQFLGFDMQYPGAAMDSVAAFIARVDSSRTSFIDSNYTCMLPYRNHGPTFVYATTQYAALPTSVKAACAAALQQVYNAIDGSQAAYTAASSPAVYEAVKHDARLVQQFEAMASASLVANGVRDQAMAENIEWIRDHAPAGARIVLWAHNGHINRVPSAMGSYLGATYGSDYVNLGFAFGHGRFNAVGANGPLQPWDAELIPSNSIEAAFTTTGRQLALLDTRLIPNASAAAPLAGPIQMRSIGALFDPSAESAYFVNAVFPNDFDLLVFVNSTTPSTLLPFMY